MRTFRLSPSVAVAAFALTLALPLEALAADKRPVIFEPVPSANTRSYFANGEPFAIVTTDSAIVMLVLDPADLVAYNSYLRLWCLYYSKASEPVLLDPGSMARLVSTKIKKHESQELAPESPTTILKLISSEAAGKEILQIIGGALAGAGKAMAVQPTTVIGGGTASGASWSVNDAADKRGAVTDKAARRTTMATQETETAYELYSRSVNAGILRRNTVFPGGSVNGYIYFLASGKYPEYQHVVALRFPHSDVDVEFNPAPGE